MGLFDWLGGGKPGKDEFAKLYVDFLLRLKLARSVQYDAANFRIQADGHSLGLYNAYRDYCAAGRSERENVLRRYASVIKTASAQGAPATWDAAKPHMLPSIRTASYPSIVRLSLALNPNSNNVNDSLVSMPLGTDALAMLALDREEAMMLVSTAQQAKWDVSADEIWSTARQNLIARSEPRFRNLGSGVLMGTWDDSYDSSRIILPELLAKAGVGDKPAVMIPTRGCLLLAPPTDDNALARMVDIAVDRVEREGRFVSAMIYQQHEGRPWPVQISDGLARKKLKDFQTARYGGSYVELKGLMDKLHAKQGKDIFVANIQVAQSASGMVSAAVWTHGIKSYLPKTDLLSFCILDKSPAQKHFVKVARWEDAQSLFPGCLRMLDDMFPTIYETLDHPTRAQIEALPAVGKMA